MNILFQLLFALIPVVLLLVATAVIASKVSAGRLSVKKSLGMNQARKIMLDAARSDMEQRFAGKKVYIHAAYTGAPENGKAWQEMVQTAFPDKDVYCAPLSLSVSCHIGAGALAVTCTKKLGE